MYSPAYLLETLGYELETDQRALEDFAVDVATGSIQTTDIALWFESHSLKF